MSPEETALDCTAVIAANQDWIYRICLRILGEPSKAEDAVQETFIDYFDQQDRIESNISGWLYWRAVNTARNMKRNENARMMRERKYATERSANIVAIQDHAWEELEKILSSLDEHKRTLLIEYYIKNTRQDLLATRLGLTRTAVTKKLKSITSELRLKYLRNQTVLPALTVVALLKGLADGPRLPAAWTQKFLLSIGNTPPAILSASNVSIKSLSAAKYWTVPLALVTISLLSYSILFTPVTGGTLATNSYALPAKNTLETNNDKAIVSAQEPVDIATYDPFFEPYRGIYRAGEWVHDHFRFIPESSKHLTASTIKNMLTPVDSVSVDIIQNNMPDSQATLMVSTPSNTKIYMSINTTQFKQANTFKWQFEYQLNSQNTWPTAQKPIPVSMGFVGYQWYYAQLEHYAALNRNNRNAMNTVDIPVNTGAKLEYSMFQVGEDHGFPVIEQRIVFHERSQALTRIVTGYPGSWVFELVACELRLTEGIRYSSGKIAPINETIE